jgi:hypothetical protein
MKQWMARATVTAGALLALLAFGKPASADLIGITINPRGTVSSGSAIVSGTLTSNDPYGDYAYLSVSVQQIVRGHVVAYGRGDWEGVVNLAQPWSFAVSSTSAPFKAGNVVVTAYATGQDQ